MKLLRQVSKLLKFKFGRENNFLQNFAKLFEAIIAYHRAYD